MTEWRIWHWTIWITGVAKSLGTSLWVTARYMLTSPPPHPRSNKQSCLLENFQFGNMLREMGCIILGDLNTNVQKCNALSLFKAFDEFFSSFKLTQWIEDASVVDDHSCSIIDLILVSNSNKIYRTGVLKLGFSDHNLIYCSGKVSRSQMSVSIRKLLTTLSQSYKTVWYTYVSLLQHLYNWPIRSQYYAVLDLNEKLNKMVNSQHLVAFI